MVIARGQGNAFQGQGHRHASPKDPRTWGMMMTHVHAALQPIDMVRALWYGARQRQGGVAPVSACYGFLRGGPSTRRRRGPGPSTRRETNSTSTNSERVDPGACSASYCMRSIRLLLPVVSATTRRRSCTTTWARSVWIRTFRRWASAPKSVALVDILCLSAKLLTAHPNSDAALRCVSQFQKLLAFQSA